MRQPETGHKRRHGSSDFRGVWPLLVGGLLVACGHQSEALLTAQAGDCYDVVVGPWTVDSAVRGRPATMPDASGDSIAYAHPVRLRLEAEAFPLSTDSALRSMSVPEEALQVPHRYLWWRSLGDSLELLVSSGFVGTVTRLAPGARSWVGTATTLDDSGYREGFRRSVMLHPVSCGSPPPVPASADPPLLRSVTLSSGILIALAEPLPVGISGVRALGRIVLREDATAPWIGADSVIVQLSLDRLVNRIQLLYPDSMVTRVLLRHEAGDRMRSLLDTLHARYGDGSPLGDFDSWHWHNRTTSVSLSLSGPSLTMYDPRIFP